MSGDAEDSVILERIERSFGGDPNDGDAHDSAIMALERACNAVEALRREHEFLNRELVRLQRMSRTLPAESSPLRGHLDDHLANRPVPPISPANLAVPVPYDEAPNSSRKPSVRSRGEEQRPHLAGLDASPPKRAFIKEAAHGAPAHPPGPWVPEEFCQYANPPKPRADYVDRSPRPMKPTPAAPEELPGVIPSGGLPGTVSQDVGDSDKQSEASSRPQGRMPRASVFAFGRNRVRHVDHGAGAANDDCWDAVSLLQTLQEKAPDEVFTLNELGKVIEELKEIHSKVPSNAAVGTQPAGMISREIIADLQRIPDISKYCRTPWLKPAVTRVMAVLGAKTVDDIIDENTRYALEQKIDLQEAAKTSLFKRADDRVSSLVSFTVLVNLVCTGVSVDVASEHPGWFGVECACTCVFAFEFVYKIKRSGFNGYFRGEAWRWNAFDFSVTVLSIMDIAFSAALIIVSNGGRKKVAAASRLPLIFRAFRLVRIVRIIKLANSPLLRDLSNMVIGCVVGLPSLLWVLCLLVLILYITGMIFRLLVGNEQEISYIELCGMAPDDAPVGDENCQLHFMFGEEFFGSVPGSMFTAFRFMLGDYGSYGGKSLIVAFEKGYGNRFRMPFVIWMIVVIFGIFNVITAVFVDATSSGLKHVSMKSNYARKYERNYVKSRLRALLHRMCELMDAAQTGDSGMSFYTVAGIPIERRLLKLEHIQEFMADDELNNILSDLDVDIWDPVGFFETCDTHCSGEVTAEEFVHGVLKLRGAPQKSDVVATFMAIRAVQRSLDHLTSATAWQQPPKVAVEAPEQQGNHLKDQNPRRSEYRESRQDGSWRGADSQSLLEV